MMYHAGKLPLIGQGGALMVLLAGVLAYLLGSCCFSYIVARREAGIDITKYGSGNPGTSNMLRVVGKGGAALTLLGDLLKGVVAVCLGLLLAGGYGMLAGAAGVIIGHCYPVFFHFKGGKAVATTAGAMAVLDWRILLMILGTFIIVVALSRYISLASCSAAVVCILAPFLVGQDLYMKALCVIVAVFVIIKHRGNLKRLLAGTETKVSFHKKELDGKQA